MGQQIEFALQQSVHRVVFMLVSFLPGVLAFLLALVVFTLLGLGLAALVRRVLRAIRFDERISSRHNASRGGEHRPTASHFHTRPTSLIARALFWVCELIGVALGLSAFDTSYAHDNVSIFLLPYFTHITGAVLLLFAGTACWPASFPAQVLISAVNAQLQYARAFALGVKWLLLVLTAAMAVDHLQIGGVVVELAFGILFGGIVLTLALAVGLGSRDIVSRSIEKSMETPFTRPGETTPPASAETPRQHVRHF